MISVRRGHDYVGESERAIGRDRPSRRPSRDPKNAPSNGRAYQGTRRAMDKGQQGPARLGMGVGGVQQLSLSRQPSKEPSYYSEHHISSRIVFPEVEKTIAVRIVFPEVEKTIAMLYGLIELYPDNKALSPTCITRKPSPTEGSTGVSGHLSGATPAPRDGFTNSMERGGKHVKNPPAASGSLPGAKKEPVGEGGHASIGSAPETEAPPGAVSGLPTGRDSSVARAGGHVKEKPSVSENKSGRVQWRKKNNDQ